MNKKVNRQMDKRILMIINKIIIMINKINFRKTDFLRLN